MRTPETSEWRSPLNDALLLRRVDSTGVEETKLEPCCRWVTVGVLGFGFVVADCSELRYLRVVGEAISAEVLHEVLVVELELLRDVNLLESVLPLLDLALLRSHLALINYKFEDA